MQQAQRLIKDMHQHRTRDLTVGAGLQQARLARFHVPVGEVVPDKAAGGFGVGVESHAGGAFLLRPSRATRTCRTERGVAIADAAREPVENPAVDTREFGVGERREVADRIGSHLQQQKAADVPQLGREVAPWRERLLEVGGVEHHIDAESHSLQEGEAHGVGAELRNHVERVDPIAERLGHLAMLHVAHRAREVHRVERRAPHAVVAAHDHASDPEEENLRGGDKRVGGIERLQVGSLLVRPAEGGEWPELRREPGVKDVGVLRERGVAALFAGGRVNTIRLFEVAFGATPHRHAVSPPNLPRDIPVADVFEPVHIDRIPPLGENTDRPLAHRLQGRGSEWGHLHEPLIAEARLDHRVAAVAVAHRMLVHLLLDQEPFALELLHDLLARVESVEADQLRGNAPSGIDPVGHRRLGGHDHRHLQVVPLAHFKIVRVVRGGDFHHASAELAVDIGIGNHRNVDVADGQSDGLPHEIGVALVLGVHGHGDVAEHGLGARRGDLDAARGIVGQRIPDVPQRAGLVVELGFFVRERGEAARAPVNHPMAAIDETVVVEAHEDFADRHAQLGAQCVRGAGPIGARANRTQLLEDHAAGLLHVRLHPLHECVATEVVAGEVLLGDLLLDDVLRRDARVVGARDPEGLVARHAAPADQHILRRVVEPVSHVQHPRHVRRGDHNGVRGAVAAVAIRTGRVGAEHAGSFPLGVEGFFGRRGVVLRRELVGSNWGRHFGYKVSHRNGVRATAGVNFPIVATGAAAG